MEQIYLIGMPLSGKSTVSHYLAALLKLPVVDCDHLIQLRAEKTIPDIFQEKGEMSFRKLETQVLKNIQGPCVVSTGGGVVTQYQNIEIMQKKGILIYLEINVETAQQRMKSSVQERPLLRDASSWLHLFQVRKNLYERAADCTIEASQAPETVAAEIHTWLQTQT